MKIAVLTGCLPNYNELAKTTVFLNKGGYCRRHDYTLELCEDIVPGYRNGASHAQGYSWSRLSMMMRLVESRAFDWVYCVGCDTMITNQMVPLEMLIAYAGRPKKSLPSITAPLPPGVPLPIAPKPVQAQYKPDGGAHVIFACDRASVVQADSFFVRGTPLGAAYLRDILDQYPTYKTENWVEQQAMADLRHRHAAITCIVPQWVMNSYDYGLYAHIGPYYDEGLDCYGHRGQWMPGDFLIHWPATSLEMRLRLAKKYDSEVIQ